MNTIVKLHQWANRLHGDRRGQDLIEYALMAALVAVAVVAGLGDWVAPSVSLIFSKVNSALISAS